MVECLDVGAFRLLEIAERSKFRGLSNGPSSLMLRSSHRDFMCATRNTCELNFLRKRRGRIERL